MHVRPPTTGGGVGLRLQIDTRRLIRVAVRLGYMVGPTVGAQFREIDRVTGMKGVGNESRVWMNVDAARLHNYHD
jgi:hypothetical protein